MNETKKVTINSGLSLGTVLFIVFLILKLTKTIAWSWWWVTSPLWIPPVVGISLVFCTFIIGALIIGLIALFNR